MLTPLPPQKTGVADYSAMLLPFLSLYFDVAAVVPCDVSHVAAVDGVGSVISIDDFDPSSFDAAIYMIGNNVEFHGKIYETALKYPGLVVLHDFVLHHLLTGLTLARDNRRGYFSALRRMHGFSAVREGKRALDLGTVWEFSFKYPMNKDLLRGCRGVIVHNQWAAEEIKKIFPNIVLEVVPHILDPRLSAHKDKKNIQNVAGQVPLILCAGHMTRAKRIDKILQACCVLKERSVDFKLSLVGDLKDDYDVRGMVRSSGISDQVETTGYVPDDELLDRINSADIVVNLRGPTAGETSGTMLKAMAAGKPVIVSDVPPYSSIPDGCCAKVPQNENEVFALASVLELLISNVNLRRALGAFGREWALMGEPLAVAARYAWAVDRAYKACGGAFLGAFDFDPLARELSASSAGGKVEKLWSAERGLGQAFLPAEMHEVLLQKTGGAWKLIRNKFKELV